jgi:hypothetical protein
LIFSDGNEKINSKGDGYISKSFDVIYRVSPPILSDYSMFMKKKWIEAFGDIVSEEEYHYITQIFDLMCPAKNPRNIIAFINEFVSIKQINNYSIPERYISLFILQKEDILSNPEEKIISLGFLGLLKQVYNNEKTSKYIASLVYQIDPEKALDIIYKNNLKLALNNCDLKQIEEIAKLPIFFDLLIDVLPEITNIENAIISVDHITETVRSQVGIHQQVWKEIYNSAMANPDMLAIDCDDCLPYQSSILDHLSDDDKTDFICFVFNKVYSSEKFNSIGYYKIVKRFKEVLEDSRATLDKILDHKDNKDREINVQQYIALLEYAKDDHPTANLSCSLGDLDEYLVSKTLEDLDSLHFVNYLDEDKKKQLTDYKALLKRLFSSQLNNCENLIKIISCQKDIGETIDTSSIPTATIRDMYNTTIEKDFHYDVIAIRLANPDKSDSNMNVFTPLLTSQAPVEDDVIKIADVIQHYIDFGDLVKNLQQMSQFPIYCEIVKYIFQENRGRFANVMVLIQNFPLVCEKISVAPELVLENYNGWLRFLKEESGLTSKIKNSFSDSFVRECMKSKTDIAKYAVEQIRIYFDGFTKEQWEACFKNPNEYDFQVALMVNYPFTTLSIEYLKNVLLGIAKGESEMGGNAEYSKLLDSLLELGHETKIKSAFKDILDILCLKAISEDMFIFFGKWLFEFSDMESKQEILRTILPPHLLDNKVCLNIISTYKSQLPKIIAKSKEDKDAFIDGLRERTKKYPSSNELKELCAVLKIDIDAPDDELLGDN